MIILEGWDEAVSQTHKYIALPQDCKMVSKNLAFEFESICSTILITLSMDHACMFLCVHMYCLIFDSRRNLRSKHVGGIVIEPTYENFPSALHKKRQRDRSVGRVSLEDGFNGPDHIYQNPARLRGSSVDRHRKCIYLTQHLKIY